MHDYTTIPFAPPQLITEDPFNRGRTSRSPTALVVYAMSCSPTHSIRVTSPCYPTQRHVGIPSAAAQSTRSDLSPDVGDQDPHGAFADVIDLHRG
jgi:hypothetical protein